MWIFRPCVRAVAGFAAMLVMVSGCTWRPLQTGMSKDQVLATWGTPTQSVALPTGERLQYSQQPSGQEVFMVDLDRAGRVAQVRQVMTAQDFARISTQGDWTRADVEREFGPSGKIEYVSRWDGPILTYRWRAGMIDLYYWVYLDQAGVVRRAHEGMDWRNMRHVP